MKPTTTSLYSVVQQFRVNSIFHYYVFFCILKEKDNIRRNLNDKKNVYLLNLPKPSVGPACTTKN